MTEAHLNPEVLSGISGVPRLNDLARVTIHQLPTSLLKLGRMFKPDMQRHRFGWYRHSASRTTWLGFKDPDIHDHDRWLMCVPDEGSKQYRVLRDGEISHDYDLNATIFNGEPVQPVDIQINDLRLRPVPRDPGHISKIIDRMDSLSTSMSMQVNFYDAKPISHRFLLHYGMMFPSLMMDEVLGLGESWDLRELHDLVYHYDTWQANNPEFADMPHELVLRMHNLHGLHVRDSDWVK